ncbi:MAG: 30S ribosomal protein S13 [Candidatus Woykebacteria bacterium]
MARIAGIEMPGNKKILFALPYIFGIGRTRSQEIIAKANIDENKRVRELTEEELSKIQKLVDNYPIEGDLRRQIQQNIRRIEEIGTYRGTRHKKGLPVRGQRTRSNARTKRGKRVTIGAIKKEQLQKMQKPPGAK